MSEHQFLWALGSKANQIVENVFNYFHREPAGDTTATIQQTAQATGVGLATIYKICSEAKSTGGCKKKKKNRIKRKMIKYLENIYDFNKR